MSEQDEGHIHSRTRKARIHDRSVPDSSVVAGRAGQPPDDLLPLDREVLGVLLQVPVAVQRNAVYPPGHPLALAATRALHTHLTSLLADRGSLAIAVARTRLVVGEAASDPTHPILRDLAQRLHRAEIGTLTIAPGVSEAELGELLVFLGREAGRGHGAASEPPALPQWPHLTLAPPAFGQLRLAGDGTAAPAGAGESKLARLWGELAAAAGGPAASDAHTSTAHTSADSTTHAPIDPAALARFIEAQPRDPASDNSIMRRLLALAREARSARGTEAAAAQEGVIELLTSLRPETLFQLLSYGANLAERQRLISEVSRAMPVGGVLEVVRASAEANQQTISHSLMRIFEKLAANANSGPGRVPTESDESLRELVAAMLQGWVLKDPNPLAYTSALDRLVAAAPPSGPGAESAPSSIVEPERIIQMALELGVYGPAVDAAVSQMVDRGEVATLTTLLAGAPADTPAAEAAWSRIATPDLVRRLLEDEAANAPLLDELLPRLGRAAAEPMLDALEMTESIATRRRLIAWLARLGPGIIPLVLQRLEASAWYVQRNMLLLLGSMPEWPTEFDPVAYLGNHDVRVRREAIKLALRAPARRDEAVCAGLEDGDEQVVSFTARVAAEGCPARALPIILALLDRGDRSGDVRAFLIRALATIPAPRARDWLIRRCLARRWWLLRTRLAPKSPEVLAALAGLAAAWSRDASAAAVLAMARQNQDPELRAAAS
ncbi:MAG TPA: hypothetical protein VFS33_00680 [Gemmatimonadales bacterium]|nr:hypothetical protein [Gemmatimonadales bacterium]